VLRLWPLLLDLLQPVMTHATIRTLQDCYALDLLEAPPYVLETCRQVHAREVAARKADRRSRVRRWLQPKALDLDPAAADDAMILRVFGPYARTEIFAGDDPVPVLVRGDAVTDLWARLTDQESRRPQLQTAGRAAAGHRPGGALTSLEPDSSSAHVDRLAGPWSFCWSSPAGQRPGVVPPTALDGSGGRSHSPAWVGCMVVWTTARSSAVRVSRSTCRRSRVLNASMVVAAS
jgi:hypothetical protein